MPNNLHLVPKDKVNKYVLMKYLKKHFGFENLKIVKKNSRMQINRVLKTSYSEINDNIWLKSNYKKKLTIKEIVGTI